MLYPHLLEHQCWTCPSNLHWSAISAEDAPLPFQAKQKLSLEGFRISQSHTLQRCVPEWPTCARKCEHTPLPTVRPQRSWSWLRELVGLIDAIEVEEMMRNWTKQEQGHREQHIRGAREEGQGGREEKAVWRPQKKAQGPAPRGQVKGHEFREGKVGKQKKRS